MDEEAQRKLREQGIERPVQRGAHSEWNERVREELETLQQELDGSGYAEGTDVYNEEARTLLESLQKKLRARLKLYSKLTERMIGRGEDVG